MAPVYIGDFLALIYEFACVLNHESFLLAFQWKHLTSFQMEAHNELTHSSLPQSWAT